MNVKLKITIEKVESKIQTEMKCKANIKIECE